MSDFPTLLRQWRGHARLSQLAAAAEAEVSARHLAYLETGRARPSRAMVLRLSQALAVPPHGCNALLDAAGFAPQFARTPLDSAALSPVREALLALLAGHAPWPGYLLDHDWRLLRVNPPAAHLLGAVGLAEGESLLALLADPVRGAQVFENWPEVGHFTLARLRAESRAAGGAPALDRAAAVLARDPAVAGFVPERTLVPMVASRIRLGEGALALWSMMVQPGGATDLTLTDLRLELLYPADVQAESVLRALSQ